MPTRKIGNNPEPKQCRHHDHEPASMRVYEPGTYEHECPGCGKKTVFHVNGVTMCDYGSRERREW